MTITDHYRATAQWLRDWAEGYDSGLSQHHTDGVADSKLIPNMLRHTPDTIEAELSAYAQLKPKHYSTSVARRPGLPSGGWPCARAP